MSINLQTDSWYCKYKNNTDLLKIKLTLEAIYKRKFRGMRFIYQSHNIFYHDGYSYQTMSSRSQKYQNLKAYSNFKEIDLNYIIRYNPPE